MDERKYDVPYFVRVMKLVVVVQVSSAVIKQVFWQLTLQTNEILELIYTVPCGDNQYDQIMWSIHV